jgi:CrcB protein
VERVLLVALGGAIGTLLRYFTSGLAAKWFGIDFPYGTIIVNLVGSFLIRLIQEIATETLVLPENARLFLTTGLMGGLTTYSAFSYETVRLAEAGAWPQAWINVVGTTAGCLLLCVAGIAVGRLLIGLRG